MTIGWLVLAVPIVVVVALIAGVSVGGLSATPAMVGPSRLPIVVLIDFWTNSCITWKLLDVRSTAIDHCRLGNRISST
jgi:hypothetical protein